MSEDIRGPAARRAAEPDTDELLANLFCEVRDDNGRNSEEAFAQLYDVTCARLHGFVLSLVSAPDIAVEITHDAYVEVWRQAARFSPAKGNVRIWMLTIAHRMAVDRVLSIQKKPEKS